MRAMLICVLLLSAFGGSVVPAQQVQLAERRDDDGFLHAGPGRPIELPGDHGGHPETRTEWWYLTGSLEGAAGELFGFQATWFRRALQHHVPAGRSALAVRDVLLFHGVVLDTRDGVAHFTELASRAYLPWAGARVDRLDVRLLGQQLVDGTGAGDQARLEFSAAGARLELELDLSGAPALLHGAEPGLSVKGHAPGQASWYYSLPRIVARGQLSLPDRNETLAVSGQAWFDHEFGSMQLGTGQVGWDWFSVALDDGTELMLYQLRLEDGQADTTSAGTLRTADGHTRHLTHESFSITPTSSWSSPGSGATYPASWLVEIPREALRLQVTPVVAGQELQTPATTNVTYWEGLCRFEGARAGAAVAGRGYVELVGYDRAIAADFTQQEP